MTDMNQSAAAGVPTLLAYLADVCNTALNTHTRSTYWKRSTHQLGILSASSVQPHDWELCTTQPPLVKANQLKMFPSPDRAAGFPSSLHPPPTINRLYSYSCSTPRCSMVTVLEDVEEETACDTVWCFYHSAVFLEGMLGSVQVLLYTKRQGS